MSIADNLLTIKKNLPPTTRLVAVSKYHSEAAIMEAYNAGQRLFGENRVQELLPKHEHLPKDIEWHFIGHLQANKVKYIAPFVNLIHSIDSQKLMAEVNREAEKYGRQIKILLQIHIAQEEHKFGFLYDEVEKLCREKSFVNYPHLIVSGLMGMATYTDDTEQIRREFKQLGDFFRQIKADFFANDAAFCELSMGMSDDYLLAVEAGSTIVRMGSKVFQQHP